MTSPDIAPYVDLTLHDLTAQTIFDRGKTLAQTRLPGWTPIESNIETVLLEALAVEVSELVFAANRLPGTIVEVLLRLYGINRDLGAVAGADVTFTLADSLGHEIPALTMLRVPLADGSTLEFRTDVGVVVPPGSNTGTVFATATSATDAANGLTVGTTLELVDAIAYVDAVRFATSPTGGRREETAEEMLTRGQALLQRLVSTLVTPQHFAAAAALEAGITRAVAIDNYDPAQANEIQRVTITGAPTGGTFTLTYAGQTTAAIAFDATAAAVVAALEGLAAIGVGDVTGAGGPLPGAAVDITFTGALAATNVAAMTATSALTGGTTPAVAVSVVREGGAAPGSHPGHITTAVSGPDGTILATATKTALRDNLAAQALALLGVHVTDVKIQTVNTDVTVVLLAGYAAADVSAAVTAAIRDYINPDTWPFGRTVYRNELIAVIDGVAGVDRVAAITTPAADVALTGPATLPNAGTVNVVTQAAA